MRALLDQAVCAGPVRMLDGSSRTAAEAAAALGVDVANIAKTLVFVAGGDPLVVVAGGASRVDVERLSGEIDGAPVTKADADAVRAATGYPIGGVSPVGLPDGLLVVVDAALASLDPIWAAAGHPRAVYRTTFDELLAVSGGREGHVVHVRPELVVEIALDGAQRSTRYPGGVALRFARVVRYREDKDADEADLIGTVQEMLG